MPLKLAVMSSDTLSSQKIQFEDVTVVETLGETEESLAVKIDDVLEAVCRQVRSSITTESELIVEMTGSVALKANAGAKWLFFNVGGGAEKSDSLKVTLKTKISPESK